MTFFTLVFIPAIVFMVFVAPIWIVFHYLTQWKRMRQAGAAPDQAVVSQAELEELRRLADRLESRIDTLERILDAEAPNWRHS